ncbi:hypothetical protein MAUB1S_09660 [Mycolicibacterium aubagnense]
MIELPKLAISIRQPWTHAIAQGWKPVENRVWYTNVRGPICLHASRYHKASWEDDAAGYRDLVEERGIGGAQLPDREELAFGCIIGTAEIVACVSEHPSRWFVGPYAMVLANARPLAEPIPIIGKLGFFEWRGREPKPKEDPVAAVPALPAQGSLF